MPEEENADAPRVELPAKREVELEFDAPGRRPAVERPEKAPVRDELPALVRPPKECQPVDISEEERPALAFEPKPRPDPLPAPKPRDAELRALDAPPKPCQLPSAIAWWLFAWPAQEWNGAAARPPKPLRP